MQVNAVGFLELLSDLRLDPDVAQPFMEWQEADFKQIMTNNFGICIGQSSFGVGINKSCSGLFIFEAFSVACGGSLGSSSFWEIC